MRLSGGKNSSLWSRADDSFSTKTVLSSDGITSEPMAQVVMPALRIRVIVAEPSGELALRACSMASGTCTGKASEAAKRLARMKKIMSRKRISTKGNHIEDDLLWSIGMKSAQGTYRCLSLSRNRFSVSCRGPARRVLHPAQGGQVAALAGAGSSNLARCGTRASASWPASLTMASMRLRNMPCIVRAGIATSRPQ